MGNGLMTIVERVPFDSRNKNNIPASQYNNSDGIERQYSLVPVQFFEALQYITYPGVKPGMYLINTRGIIFNATTRVILTNYDTDADSDYQAVTLQTVAGGKKFLVHRLVAYQFCNPPIDFANRIVNHIDTNKRNNFANNLEWVTVAANNQHAREFYNGTNTFIVNKRPIVNENFVRYLCEEFQKGKSNTEIMNWFGMELNNSNHTLLRDIRGGYTWRHISSQYNFDRSSKKHAYSKEEKETIKKYIYQEKTDKEIFAIMNGREYIASTDRLDSLYRTIYTIRASLKGEWS
jgi:hypothetical protein